MKLKMDHSARKYDISFKNNVIENLVQNFGENVSFKYDESINRPVFFQMIEPIYSFTGREEELRNINESVLNNKTTVVSGFGGIGKTEIVRFYSYQNKTDNIVWINAELESSVNTSFKNLANKLFVALQHNGMVIFYCYELDDSAAILEETKNFMSYSQGMTD